jgi:hypothetical protein
MFNASFITAPEKIEQELAEIQGFLELEFAGDDMSQCKQRMQDLSVYMARSGKLKADAEHHYHKVLNGAVVNALKDVAALNMGTSTLNKYIESMCRDYKQLEVWADRVNRSATHQIDALRTLLSYAKSERNYQ